MAELEHYKGREQAFIKHNLLRAYLKRLFMIIGKHEKRIRYVDCFAGPWKEGSDDLRDTSISISLNIMRECRESLLQLGRNVDFKALYIEKDKKAFGKLKAFLDNETSNEVQAYCEHGEFYPLRDRILNWCGEDDFTFFFIDPTGWKSVVEPDTLMPLFKRKHSEFLITFMFDFLLRVHSQKGFREHMKRIFGDVPDTTGMEPKQRENYLLEKYLEKLKGSLVWTGKSPRLAYVKILDPLKDRTKYDLVYLTRHPLGITVFMKESEKLYLFQKKVRAQVKQEHRIKKTGQDEFRFKFEDSTIDNDRVDLTEVKDYWLNKLSYVPKRFGNEQLSDMLEETRWFIGDFQKAFNNLINEGKVENLDAPGRRPIHAVHFEKKERLRKLNP